MGGGGGSSLPRVLKNLFNWHSLFVFFGRVRTSCAIPPDQSGVNPFPSAIVRWPAARHRCRRHIRCQTRKDRTPLCPTATPHVKRQTADANENGFKLRRIHFPARLCIFLSMGTLFWEPCQGFGRVWVSPSLGEVVTFSLTC